MILGIDFGASKIAAGLVENGRVLRKEKIATPKSQKEIVAALVDLIKKFDEKKVGMAIAGQIDAAKGEIIFSPNMQFLNNFPIVAELSKKLGADFRIKIDNDVNCFTLAEWKYGAGRDTKNLIGLTIGTGIGSGAILDGRYFHGQSFAPELGHLTLEASGRECACGQKGHFEAYSSGQAIAKQFAEKTGKTLLPTEIEKLALGGDVVAREIYGEAKKYLVLGLANIINAYDPEMIVIGGSVGLRSEILWQNLENEVAQKILFKNRKVEYSTKPRTSHGARAKIIKAQLGDDAGIIGGAMLFD